ncbi:MAG: glycosyltransferase family 4 protein [Bacteroidetes bacterium]|nr:glycosyltransferase family 4 protein [Bacteroidota bacterium]
MKKLLILTDWYEPAYKAGGPVRSCVNLAEAMKDRFEVYVLTGDRDFGDKTPFSNVKLDSWTEQKAGSKVFYLSLSKQKSREIRKVIHELEPDVLYLNSMYSLSFTILPLLLHRFGRISGKLVLAPRGMLQAGALQFKSLKKRVFLFLMRMLGMGKRIHWHATDQQEKKDIQAIFPGATSISLIANLPRQEQGVFERINKEAGSLKVIFISRISKKKNLEFLLQALSLVKASVRLEIAGPIESEPYWQKCQKRIDSLPTNIQTNYVGAVKQEYVLHILKKNHIFVLPTHGENFGHGIFESLLAGRPVIISPFTPWQDLDESNAGKLCRLEDPRQLATHIEHYAQMDVETYTQRAKAAWNYAHSYLENENQAEAYEQMFR